MPLQGPLRLTSHSDLFAQALANVTSRFFVRPAGDLHSGARCGESLWSEKCPLRCHEQ